MMAGLMKSPSCLFYFEEIIAVNLTIFYHEASLSSAAEVGMH